MILKEGRYWKVKGVLAYKMGRYPLLAQLAIPFHPPPAFTGSFSRVTALPALSAGLQSQRAIQKPNPERLQHSTWVNTRARAWHGANLHQNDCLTRSALGTEKYLGALLSYRVSWGPVSKLLPHSPNWETQARRRRPHQLSGAMKGEKRFELADFSLGSTSGWPCDFEQAHLKRARSVMPQTDERNCIWLDS